MRTKWRRRSENTWRRETYPSHPPNSTMTKRESCCASTIGTRQWFYCGVFYNKRKVQWRSPFRWAVRPWEWPVPPGWGLDPIGTAAATRWRYRRSWTRGTGKLRRLPRWRCGWGECGQSGGWGFAWRPRISWSWPGSRWERFGDATWQRGGDPRRRRTRCWCSGREECRRLRWIEFRGRRRARTLGVRSTRRRGISRASRRSDGSPNPPEIFSGEFRIFHLNIWA